MPIWTSTALTDLARAQVAVIGPASGTPSASPIARALRPSRSTMPFSPKHCTFSSGCTRSVSIPVAMTNGLKVEPGVKRCWVGAKPLIA